MMSKRLKAIERLRIIMAKKLGIPPDDIDMLTIIDCVERAIREECEKEISDEYYTVTPRTQEEVEAITSDHGSKIVHEIFAKESPFHDWVDRYEEFYLKSFIDQLNGENK